MRCCGIEVGLQAGRGVRYANKKGRSGRTSRGFMEKKAVAHDAKNPDENDLPRSGATLHHVQPSSRSLRREGRRTCDFTPASQLICAWRRSRVVRAGNVNAQRRAQSIW